MKELCKKDGILTFFLIRGARPSGFAKNEQNLGSTFAQNMDALFGLVVRNDAERTRLELLGWTWRRDWGMCNFDT